MVRRFLLLNGIAIIGAVAYHASGWGFIAMFWWTDRYAAVSTPNFDQMGSVAYFALRALEQLIIFAVPAFLFVSGFFIAFAAGRTRGNIQWKVIGARIQSLLIPYLLWSVLIWVAAFAQGQRYTPLQYVELFITGRTASPYYFVPLLIQFFLLSPLLVPLAKKRGLLLLALTAVIQLAVRTLIYLNTLEALPAAVQPLMPVTASWFFPGHLFWFTWGIVAGFHIEALKRLLPRIKWVALAAVVILFPLGMLEWELVLQSFSQVWIGARETILDSFFAAAIILAFLAFGDLKIPYAAELSDLGGKSFGIYLAHSPVLEYTARAIYLLAPWILAHQILFQPILIFMGLAVPLLLMHIARLERSPVRVYYQYIFG